jgi:type I restriction enzyme, S subunit
MAKQIIQKGYKQTEIGIIPEDWRFSTVKNEFEICDNLRLPINQNTRKKMIGVYPYYGPTGILDYINQFRVDGEYALIGEDGDHFLKWQKQPMTILVKGKFNVNNHAHLVKGRKNLTSWFYWYFVNKNISKYLTKQGAGRLKLTKTQLEKIPCIIPSSLLEQKKISEVLLDIDNLIHNFETLIEKKHNIKKGTMQKLLTGEKRLEGFSDEWVTKRLQTMGKIFSGSSAPQEEKYFIRGSFPFVRVSDLAIKLRTKNLVEVRDYINKHCISTNPLVKAKKGTTIFPKSGASVGNNNRAQLGMDAYIVSHLAAIFSKDNSNEFIYYLLCMIDMLDYVGDKNYPSLKISEIKNIKVKVPKNKNEQKAISQILLDMDNEIEILTKRFVKYKMIKKGMMQKLLTGEIRIK